MPISGYFNQEALIIVEIDLSGFVSAEISLEYLENNTNFQPAAYFNKKYINGQWIQEIDIEKLLIMI